MIEISFPKHFLILVVYGVKFNALSEYEVRSFLFYEINCHFQRYFNVSPVSHMIEFSLPHFDGP